MYVEPAVAAPGGPLRIHVRLDASVAESDLIVTIGGAVRPSFRLLDRQPAAVVDGAAELAAPDASSAASLADCALISVLAPVLHTRGPWIVQIHAHGTSSVLYRVHKVGTAQGDGACALAPTGLHLTSRDFT